MARFVAYPTPEQEIILTRHCSDARYVWNLALEQQKWWKRGGTRTSYPPNSAERYHQLTEARADNEWLEAGSIVVQQQALRDFDQAMNNFFKGTHRFPNWRRQSQYEGFRVTGGRSVGVRILNRKWSAFLVPKVGWVKFRQTRGLPIEDIKSYRVTMDRAGKWYVSFALVPEPIPAPGTGEIVGVDRGVSCAFVTSDGKFLDIDTKGLDQRIKRASQTLARCKRGSNRRKQARLRLARLYARKANTRKDFAEKTSTMLAREYDLIRVEDLRITNMTRSAKGTVDEPGKNVAAKAGLNKAILDKAWGLTVRRLEQKAPGRVEKVDPAYTSQRCSECGHVDKNSRESQALFCCTSCGVSLNADVNAARNIAAGRSIRPAAGHAVAARGDLGVTRSMKREPRASLAPTGQQGNKSLA